MAAQQASTFQVVPAIDLRAGRVVRLIQGDFARERVFADDPVLVARAFAAAGASWIHVVDLDGARAGERRQTSSIARIVAEFDGDGPRFQVAGGLRTAEAVAEAITAGADRIVIGTAALLDSSIVAAAITQHGPDRIAVAVAVRDGLAIGDGWVSTGRGVPLAALLDRLGAIGVATIAVTAIEHDGLLGGPDLALLDACVRSTAATVLASGGIRSIADLEAVRAVGCGGAIVGRAIYDESLDLRAAIVALNAATGAAPGPLIG